MPLLSSMLSSIENRCPHFLSFLKTLSPLACAVAILFVILDTASPYRIEFPWCPTNTPFFLLSAQPTRFWVDNFMLSSVTPHLPNSINVTLLN